jgi:predicted Zn-dependent protease
VPARIVLAAAATLVAAAMAVQLHAHELLKNSVAQVQREIAGKPDQARHDAAVDDALRVAGLQPGTGGLFVAIGLETRGKRPAEAERLALRATRREPRNFATWLTLGVIRQGRGDDSGAKTAFAQAAKLNPLYRTPR